VLGSALSFGFINADFYFSNLMFTGKSYTGSNKDISVVSQQVQNHYVPASAHILRHLPKIQVSYRGLMSRQLCIHAPFR